MDSSPRAGAAAHHGLRHVEPVSGRLSKRAVLGCIPCACRIPGIVDLCGTADDASNIYLVFEPCFGGDLYKRLAHHGLYEEAQLCKEV